MKPALKYLLLTIVFMFLSSGALVAGFLDVYDSVGYGIFWLLLPMTLLFISAVVVNDRLFIPRLLLRGRYECYCSGVFGVVYLFSFVALLLEYGTRSCLEIPMRISDYSNPWILAEVLGNSLLLAMILLGLGLLHLYRGWRAEAEEEKSLACRLESYISTVNKRLNLAEILEKLRASPKRLCKALHNAFKWIKQHLRVTTFWGNSENAVRIQVYVAISTYCLVCIMRQQMQLNQNAYEILRILGSSFLTKDHIVDLFTDNGTDDKIDDSCQLRLDFGV